MKSSEPSEGAKSTVAQVSVEYLRLCILANMKMIPSYVLLSEYIASKKMTMEEYTDEVKRLARRWPIDQHPVIQLHLLETKLQNDKATVTFQRDGSKSNFPKVMIHLEWTGNNWIVVNDSIFGQGGLFREK
jgi:hypothetical protein